ncbi:hypothetical protein ABE419_25895 [Brevibacillus agri]|uniref:hypothetical protein n=1 Tax=Brevibacillus agri TaxID=51101 RepID=UPI003D241C6D
MSEVRFIENNQQVSCWKSDSNPDELKVSKFHFFDDAGNYPDNYYSFWTHLEVEMLYDLKDMQTLLEIMEYIKDLPPKEDKRIEILGSSDEEEIPY